jgi:hypothetical protein
MTVNEILTLVNFIINKETTGDALNPDNYNVLLQEVNVSMFNEYWGQYQQLLVMKGNDLLSNSPLTPFIEVATITVDPANGMASIPTDFIEGFAATVNQTGQKIDLVSPMEAYYRNSSVMTIPATNRNYGFINGSQLQCFPYKLSTGTSTEELIPVTFSYLRLPLQPVYDYCQSATTYKRIFMPASSYLIYSGGVWSLYQDAVSHPQLLTANVTKTGAGTTSPAYTSLTVELEWRENMHPLFVSRVLSKVGINLSEQGVTQYAELLKKEGL